MFKCDTCNFKTKYKHNLYVHKNTQHSDKIVWYFCEFKECDFKTKTSRYLKKHIESMHKNRELKYICDVEDCGFKTTNKVYLKKHIENIHTTTEEFKYTCDVENCDFKTKYSNVLKNHKASIHDIDVVWFECDHCDYKCKRSHHLDSHLSTKHDIKVEWFECKHCDYKTKIKNNLDVHLIAHNINVTWFLCEHCDYKTKRSHHLEAHLANIHDIGVIWYECDIENCEKKFKSKSSLASHKLFIHDINVKWYYCDYEYCDYKAKKKTCIKKHFNSMHTKRGIQRQKKQEERISKILDKHDIIYEREVKIDFNCFNSGKNYAYIDYVIQRPKHIILLEIDENCHRYGYTIGCDMKRMSHIITALKFQSINRKILFIRYNPDNYKVDEKTIKTPLRKEREIKLINIIKTYIPNKDLEIKYMYYDIFEGNLLLTYDNEYHQNFKECLV